MLLNSHAHGVRNDAVNGAGATNPDSPSHESTERGRTALFSLGLVVATPPAIAAMQQVGVAATELLRRHQMGDWGALDREDAATNRQAVVTGERVFSSFTCDNVTFWVITEADRSSTCVLLPSCY